MVDWKTGTNPDYENLSMAFLEAYALNLKQAFLAEGISEKKAEAVVETAVFNLAVLFDQGKIRLSEQPFKPLLAFRDQLGQLDTGQHARKFELHDCALSMVSSAFDGNDW